MAKQLDYFERACREEELPLLEEAYEKQKKEDKTYYDDNIKVFLEQHRKTYEMNLAEKARFTKILDEKDSFETSFIARKKEIYKKAKSEQEERLKGTIELRRREREERRAEEAFRKQEEERLIKEKEEEEARLKREAEDREKLKEQKKKEEMERKSKLDAQAQLQRKREEEAIAKQKQQFDAVLDKKEEPTPTSPVAEKIKEPWKHSKSMGPSNFRDEKLDDRKWGHDTREPKDRPSFERSNSVRSRGEDRWGDTSRRYEEDRNVSGNRLPERTGESYRPNEYDRGSRGGGSGGGYRDDRQPGRDDRPPGRDDRPPGRDDYRKRTDERGPPPSSIDSGGGYRRPAERSGDDRGSSRGGFERRNSDRWGSGSRATEEGDWKREKSFHKDDEHSSPSTHRSVDEDRERSGPPAVSRKPVSEEESAPIVKKSEEPMVRRDSKRDFDREGQSQSSKERARSDSFRDKGPRNGDRPPERKKEEKPAAPVEKEEEVDADGFQTVKKKKNR